MARLAAPLALVFSASVVLAIRETASANPFLLAFGVSGEFGWLFYLPWIVAVVTVGMVFRRLAGVAQMLVGSCSANTLLVRGGGW